MKKPFALPLLVFLSLEIDTTTAADAVPDDVAGCYVPTEGGWRIRITSDPAARRLVPGSAIGVVGDNVSARRRRSVRAC